MINVGFIGCGSIGRDHIERITNQIAGGKVTGIFDVVDAAARKAVDDFGLDAQIFSSADALIESKSIDAVVVASRNDAHLQPLLKAISVGKPVFTEKPMTISGEDSLKIVEAEVALGHKFTRVGFNWRFDPGYAALKKYVDSGEIGSLLLAGMRHYNARAATTYYRTDNVINDTLIHNFDILHYLFNDEYRSIEMKFARQNSLNPNPAENLREPQLAIFEFAHGAIATAEANINCQYGYDIQCRLVGESGIVSLPDVATPEIRREGQISHAIDSSWTARFVDAYNNEFRAFFDDVENDHEPASPVATAWDGYVASVTADAAIESLHGAGKVPLTFAERPALYA